jgi:hypothetical protein
MASVERTLVKSPPELWGLIDDSGRARAWMATLGVDGHPAASDRRPEEAIVWASNGARIEFALEEKGWGTQVSISSEAAGARALERMLDELASPERKPFRRE